MGPAGPQDGERSRPRGTARRGRMLLVRAVTVASAPSRAQPTPRRRREPPRKTPPYHAPAGPQKVRPPPEGVGGGLGTRGLLTPTSRQNPTTGPAGTPCPTDYSAPAVPRGMTGADVSGCSPQPVSPSGATAGGLTRPARLLRAAQRGNASTLPRPPLAHQPPPMAPRRPACPEERRRDRSGLAGTTSARALGDARAARKTRHRAARGYCPGARSRGMRPKVKAWGPPLPARTSRRRCRACTGTARP